MKTAVFVGRFALLTRAHVTTARTILDRWPRLIVAVLDLTITPPPPPALVRRFAEFYALSAASTGEVDNPFTARERARLLRDALTHAGLAERAEPVTVIQPELSPDWFNRRFPPGDYDLVTVAPTPQCSRFDHIRTTVFEQILARPVAEIVPPVIEHTSAILRQIAAGRHWAEFLAPGTLATFYTLDGPHRMQARLDQAAAAPSRAGEVR